MEIKLHTDSAQWDALLRTLDQAPSFLQSAAWGNILASENKTILRATVEHSGQPVLAAQIAINKTLVGSYFSIPGGPVGTISRETLGRLRHLAREQNAFFVRIEPPVVPSDSVKHLVKTTDLNPATTNILKLDKPFSALEEAMHKKTRASLRQARASDLVVEQKKDLDIFLALIKKTSERGDFRPHLVAHYQAVLASPSTIQFIAYKDTIAVATAVCIGLKPTFTYLFAASDYEKRDLAAPYALQEAIITYALTQGYTQYDFFGIAPKKESSLEGEYDYDANHPYAGITKFKIRFGGNPVARPGTHDLIVSNFKYRVYQLLRFFRRLV